MTPPPLLPWVEANQGLIAIVTLASALLVALFEQWRSHRAELGRHGDFRKAVLDLCDRLIEEIDASIGSLEAARGPTAGQAADGVWYPLAMQTRGAIEELMPAAPPSAKVILAATAIKHWLHPSRDLKPTNDVEAALRAFRARREQFVGLREDFVAAFS